MRPLGFRWALSLAWDQCLMEKVEDGRTFTVEIRPLEEIVHRWTHRGTFGYVDAYICGVLLA